MPAIERLRVFPVKALDGIEVEEAEIREGGTLAFDREFALFDDDGEVVNGKRTDRVHELATDFDPGTALLSVETPSGDERAFHLDETADRHRAEQFFGDYFDIDVRLRRDQSLGYVDRRDMGPSVISTATLETVASWFDDLTTESARRRLRANVEISGVPAFWEDQFVGEGAPAFAAGDVRFEGVTPCGRCVVPQRDPDTGDPLPAFKQRFVEKREETFPDWADEDAFDHYYTLMLIARIPEAFRDHALAVGDTIEELSDSD